MKMLLRYCPICIITTLQAKIKPDLGVFSCHPDTLYWCSNCNKQNYDTLIHAPYPDYYEGRIIHTFITRQSFLKRNKAIKKAISKAE